MKKSIFFLIGLCIFIYQDAYSQEISQEMAQRVAEDFFCQSSKEANFSMEAHLFGNRNMPTMYAFSLSNCWVLVAGDRRVRPILAYSDENSGAFPTEEDMPPAMLYMLEWYSGQIDALRSDDTVLENNPQWNSYLNTNSISVIDRSIVIGPLLIRNSHENAWDQSGNGSDNPVATRCYNKFCPSATGCSHTVTGCVATAMGQLMWYWQWPHIAIVTDDNNNRLVRNYDWSLMPYQLVNESSIEEANMVANLLHDAGVAVHMNYGCNGSSANPDSIPSALRNIYSFNSDNLLYRSSYLDNTWTNMIKTDLNNYKPVLYGGRNSNGGHRFVIDGYDSNDMFHINFGWGGDYNNYYTLNAIYNNYNTNQTMVRNICPNYPSCSLITIPSSDVWPTYFVIQNGGGINVGNRTITSGMHGGILSEEYVKLTSGFKVNAGAEVYIAVRDMHCDDRVELYESDGDENEWRTPQRHEITNEESSARKFIRDGQLYILRNGNTYTITGMEIE